MIVAKASDDCAATTDLLRWQDGQQCPRIDFAQSMRRNDRECVVDIGRVGLRQTSVSDRDRLAHAAAGTGGP